MMEVSGQIAMQVPLGRTLQAWRKPENLKLLMPKNSTVANLTPTTYAFEIIPPKNLIPASLKGEMTIKVIKPGKVFNLTASSQIPLIGGVRFTLVLNFSGDTNSSAIGYEGSVIGTRLIGLMLKQQERAVADRLEAGFISLRDHLVRSQKNIDLRLKKQREATA